MKYRQLEKSAEGDSLPSSGLLGREAAYGFLLQGFLCPLTSHAVRIIYFMSGDEGFLLNGAARYLKARTTAL